MSTHQLTDLNERRQHLRLESDEKLFFEISGCEQNKCLEGVTLLCSAIDASGEGLKLYSTENTIYPGIELDMWVNIDGRPGRYFLSGKVRWCMPAEDGHYAGVQLLELDNTDICDWQALFT
jgi:hypothetical protein